MSSPTAFYIPEQSGSFLVDQQVRAIALEIAELKTAHVLDEQKIQQLEQQIAKKGVRVWDYETTYSKDEVVLHGTTPRDTWFYRSLTDNNKGRFPSSGVVYWVIMAGNYEPTQIAGVASTDIASVTSAIKAGELDHETAVTIGETAPVVNIGTGAAATTINLGGAGDTVAVAGTLVTVNTDNLQVKDNLVRLNRQGLAGSGGNAGIEIEEAGAVAAYIKTNGSRDGFVLKAPASSEFALDQSVAMSSSPSFQSLTTAGYVNSTGLFTNKGIAINNWDDAMLNNNYCFIGRNRIGGTGRMSFGVHPGGGYGGFDWVTIGSGGTTSNVPMTLSRDGALEVTGSIKAPSGTINGNLTVTGAITASNMPASQNASLVGLWGGAFSGLAGGVYVKKFGPIVSLRIAYFELGANHATNEGVFSEMLPTWARPTGLGSRSLSFAVPFINGTSTLARLYINGAGRISFRPISTWSLSPAYPDGELNVTYDV